MCDIRNMALLRPVLPLARIKKLQPWQLAQSPAGSIVKYMGRDAKSLFQKSVKMVDLDTSKICGAVVALKGFEPSN